MAKQELENKGTVVEETEKTPEQEPNVVVVTKKTGIGTALKIGGGLLVAATLTGLGWILRGLIGGKTEDDTSGGDAETEHPEE